MAGPAPISHRNFGNLRGVALANALDSTDAVPLSQAQGLANTAQANANAYTDSQLAGLASGQTPKGLVRASTATNIVLATPGSTIDGLTPGVGQVFWLAGQTTGSQNGPYTWNGATVPMTRAPNWDSAGEAVIGSYWVVAEGTQADAFLLLTNDTFVLGTTTATVKYIGIAQAATIDGYSETCPATSAGGIWTVTHNLNTKKLIVQVFKVAGDGDLMDPPAVRRPSISQITLHPDIALALSEYEVMVKRVVV